MILSPHLDDAVFSCWHLIRQPGAAVVTVFDGIPDESVSTLWDRLCGDPHSAAMMRQRLKENDAVLTDAGVTHYSLGYLDAQYHTGDRPISEMCEAVLARLPDAAEFFVPLAGSAVWRHPDHVAVREIGSQLSALGKKVSYYADVPYMQMPLRCTPAYQARLAARAERLTGRAMAVECYMLNDAERQQKRAAMHRYASQYRMTNLVAGGTLARKANLRREVVCRPLADPSPSPTAAYDH